MSEKEAFGAVVRALRQALGWSQEELADCAGLHRTYIGGIERGERNVSLENIHNIARALGTSAGRLLTDADKLLDG
ncbi:MAG: helix-turn-helix domain-containing protein [Planctomycetia bacterium]|nr:helix-turn-helix domain-containing protein [Planctomycetia bacterium]